MKNDRLAGFDAGAVGSAMTDGGASIKKSLRGTLTLAAGLGAVALKFGKLLLAGLKLGKFGGTFITMIATIGIYSLTYGWAYAAGFVCLILIHELGHYIAARQRGLNVGAPTFIPFVGAWIELKDNALDPETEAYVGIAGPVAGSAAALACSVYGTTTGQPLWLALGYSGYILNLFNLLPVRPLDGGRVTQLVSPHIWLLGIPLLVALFFYRPSPMLVLVGILAVPQAWRAWKNRSEEHARLALADPSARWGYGLFYLGLTVSLAVLSFEAHLQLQR